MQEGQKRLKNQNKEIKAYKNEVESKRRILKEYELMFQDFPAPTLQPNIECKFCTSKFRSVYELKTHHGLKHEDKDLNITSEMLITVLEDGFEIDPEVDAKEEKFELI